CPSRPGVSGSCTSRATFGPHHRHDGRLLPPPSGRAGSARQDLAVAAADPATDRGGSLGVTAATSAQVRICWLSEFHVFAGESARRSCGDPLDGGPVLCGG